MAFSGLNIIIILYIYISRKTVKIVILNKLTFDFCITINTLQFD